jgi:hypothetical protein
MKQQATQQGLAYHSGGHFMTGWGVPAFSPSGRIKSAPLGLRLFGLWWG